LTRAEARGRETALTVLGAAALLLSLFLTWSHQFTGAAASAALRGVPKDATAWQLYTMMDVALALLAAGLAGAAVSGTRRARLIAGAAALAALAFVAHAVAVPPTNGLPLAVAHSATAGAGETLAIAGLVVALVGLSGGRNGRYSAR
jgi:hypothetical protein